MKIIVLKPDLFEKAWMRALPMMRHDFGILASYNALLISSENLEIGSGDLVPLGPDDHFSFSIAQSWIRNGFEPDLFDGIGAYGRD